MSLSTPVLHNLLDSLFPTYLTDGTYWLHPVEGINVTNLKNAVYVTHTTGQSLIVKCSRFQWKPCSVNKSRTLIDHVRRGKVYRRDHTSSDTLGSTHLVVIWASGRNADQILPMVLTTQPNIDRVLSSWLMHPNGGVSVIIHAQSLTQPGAQHPSKPNAPRKTLKIIFSLSSDPVVYISQVA